MQPEQLFIYYYMQLSKLIGPNQYLDTRVYVDSKGILWADYTVRSTETK